MMERGVVYLRGKGWDDFRTYLYSVRISAARMGDRAVASVAAEGRKRGTGIEERLFNLGGQSIKWHKGGWQEGGTRYDPSLGGYRAERNERIRMLHFGWESSAEALSMAGTAGSTSKSESCREALAPCAGASSSSPEAVTMP